jgi:putative phosphoribosyl transferase
MMVLLPARVAAVPWEGLIMRWARWPTHRETQVIPRRFRDRRNAGRRLALALASFAGRHDVVVLGLPRGGVPVAFEVAHALRVPLDVFAVRKIGVPGNEELAMGAIGSGGFEALDSKLIAELGLSWADVLCVVERERRELARRQTLYRDHRSYPQIAGNVVILIDDGLATGASMFVAVDALRAMQPARIVVAVPVAPSDALRSLCAYADDVVCLQTPENFGGVGGWYDDFEQVSDDEVRRLLARAQLERV